MKGGPQRKSCGVVVDNVSYFLFGSFIHSSEPERLENKLKLSGQYHDFTTNSNLPSIPNILHLSTSDRDFRGKLCITRGE